MQLVLQQDCKRARTPRIDYRDYHPDYLPGRNSASEELPTLSPLHEVKKAVPEFCVDAAQDIR